MKEKRSTMILGAVGVVTILLGAGWLWKTYGGNESESLGSVPVPANDVNVEADVEDEPAKPRNRGRTRERDTTPVDKVDRRLTPEKNEDEKRETKRGKKKNKKKKSAKKKTPPATFREPGIG